VGSLEEDEQEAKEADEEAFNDPILGLFVNKLPKSLQKLQIIGATVRIRSSQHWGNLRWWLVNDIPYRGE